MALQPDQPVGPPDGIPLVVTQKEGKKGIKNHKLVAAVILLLVIAAGVFFFILPKLSGTQASQGLLPGSVTTAETVIPIVTTSLPAPMTTSIPTPEPDPFPGALSLKERFPFGTEKVASEATVYKYWINDTYQWHNDMDNHYYVQSPKAGNKYLFIFVHLVNNGDTRVWFPSA